MARRDDRGRRERQRGEGGGREHACRVAVASARLAGAAPGSSLRSIDGAERVDRALQCLGAIESLRLPVGGSAQHVIARLAPSARRRSRRPTSCSARSKPSRNCSSSGSITSRTSRASNAAMPRANRFHSRSCSPSAVSSGSRERRSVRRVRPSTTASPLSQQSGALEASQRRVDRPFAEHEDTVAALLQQADERVPVGGPIAQGREQHGVEVALERFAVHRRIILFDGTVCPLRSRYRPTASDATKRSSSAAPPRLTASIAAEPTITPSAPGLAQRGDLLAARDAEAAQQRQAVRRARARARADVRRRSTSSSVARAGGADRRHDVDEAAARARRRARCARRGS